MVNYESLIFYSNFIGSLEWFIMRYLLNNIWRKCFGPFLVFATLAPIYLRLSVFSFYLSIKQNCHYVLVYTFTNSIVNIKIQKVASKLSGPIKPIIIMRVYAEFKFKKRVQLPNNSLEKDTNDKTILFGCC